MTSPSQPDHIGPRYRVQRRLGKGGMASIYEVADLSLGTVVALKQLSPDQDPQKARQVELLFEREFHTLAELSHPRVIAVYDYGIEAGAPYYTMELLDGGDLRERVAIAVAREPAGSCSTSVRRSHCCIRGAWCTAT